MLAFEVKPVEFLVLHPVFPKRGVDLPNSLVGEG